MHRKIFKNNRRFLLVWFIIFTCLTGCSGIGRQQDTGNESTLEEVELSEDAKSETAGQREQSGADDEDEKVSSGEICVYVCGQVKHPGVYRLDADSRICDAIRLAGGLTGKAASVSVNQAEKMQDGQQIYIPSRRKQLIITVLQKKRKEQQRLAAVPAVQTHRELPVKSILTRREKKS